MFSLRNNNFLETFINKNILELLTNKIVTQKNNEKNEKYN